MDERTVRYFDDRKFMWDGDECEAEADAREKERVYGEDGFEVQVVEDGDKFLVYTRRVVTDIVVEG